MISSCATTPDYVDVANRIPPLQTGNARVYLYNVNHTRLSPLTSPLDCLPNLTRTGIVYRFSIDDQPVGEVTGCQVLFVDHPAR